MTLATKENAVKASRIAEKALRECLGVNVTIPETDAEFLADFLAACVGRLPAEATLAKPRPPKRRKAK